MAADFRALAKRLIDANGRTVTITRLSNAPANPAQPWRGPNDPRDSAEGAQSVSGLAAFVPLGGGDLGIKFSELEPDDKVLLFPAADDGGNNLEDFDEVVDGTTRYRIIETQILQPGATRFMYFFRVAQ